MSDLPDELRTRHQCTAGFTRDIYSLEHRDLDLRAADEIEQYRKALERIKSQAEIESAGTMNSAFPYIANLASDALGETTKDTQPTEKCMFCDTRIEVPAPNQYAVICAPCRQQAYETADRLTEKVGEPPRPPGYAHHPAGYVTSAFACLRDAQFHPAYSGYDHKARRVIETARDLLQHELEKVSET